MTDEASNNTVSPMMRRRWLGMLGGTLSLGVAGFVTGTDEPVSEYIGTDIRRGREVDAYRRENMSFTAYIHPETAYALRFETTGFGVVSGTYKTVEYYDHTEVEGIDWELLKDRSVQYAGTNFDRETLETLPWDKHQTE